MKKIKPKKLQKGDTIGILAVSGRIKEYERIEKAKSFFENEGYNVVISNTCKTSHRYMAGNNDEECINMLHDFFKDKSVNAILCARGGYGTLRLINKIDWNVIKDNPKIFAGYSDITVLLNMIFKKTGLITFHSAMANGDFAENIEDYTKDSFFNTLKGNTVCFKSNPVSHSAADSSSPSKCSPFKVVTQKISLTPSAYREIFLRQTENNGNIFNSGCSKGILWGGNLSSLVSLCGIDFIPDRNLILFLEDLNEPIYKIDKMLTQLFNIKKIQKNVKGIALGEFQNINNTNQLNELFEEFAQKLNIPICGGFKITHGKIKDTLPVGANVYFNSAERSITIKESYTI